MPSFRSCLKSESKPTCCSSIASVAAARAPLVVFPRMLLMTAGSTCRPWAGGAAVVLGRAEVALGETVVSALASRAAQSSTHLPVSASTNFCRLQSPTTRSTAASAASALPLPLPPLPPTRSPARPASTALRTAMPRMGRL